MSKIEYTWWQRLGQKFGATRLGGWMLMNVTTHIDPLVMRLTNGRVHIGRIGGVPCVLLTTIGAKSGLERTVTLMSIPDGENIILIASAAGSHRHPGWYYNLRANPEVTLYIHGKDAPYTAREADGAERERLWEKATNHLIGYQVYQQRAQSRLIPVIVLEPRPNK